jgi:acyl CoA:acetate/3-ketoacid CoA transferase
LTLPKVSPQLKRMDRRIFCPEPMKADLEAKARRDANVRAVA